MNKKKLATEIAKLLGLLILGGSFFFWNSSGQSLPLGFILLPTKWRLHIKKHIVPIAILFLSLLASPCQAANPSQPFLGCQYKNIQWVSHTHTLPVGDKTAPSPEEADYRGQEDVGKVDLFGDGKSETIKAIWGIGVSDHSLKIEVYKDDKLFATLEPKGIQPNFKIEDVDGDGKLEMVLWGALWDSLAVDENGKDNPAFEGHSEPHIFTVSIYKPTDTGYQLAKEYVTKKKYEPFCEEQPKDE